MYHNYMHNPYQQGYPGQPVPMQNQQNMQQFPPMQQPQQPMYYPPPQQPPPFRANPGQDWGQASRYPEPAGYADDYDIPPQELNYNDVNTYVKPLVPRESLHLDQDFVAPGTGLNENGFAPRRSPVDVVGLKTISTSQIEEPTRNPDDIKREREMEARMFAVPQASSAALKPIDVSRSDKGPDPNSVRAERDADISNIRTTAPPPEAIRCGWREYQGGATWEDINRYRDYEMNELRQSQREQQNQAAPLYYY